jgi:hypothetical protein
VEPPADDGGAPLSGYSVHVHVQEGNVSRRLFFEPNEPVLVKGLEPNTSYSIEVKAENKARKSSLISSDNQFMTMSGASNETRHVFSGEVEEIIFDHYIGYLILYIIMGSAVGAVIVFVGYLIYRKWKNGTITETSSSNSSCSKKEPSLPVQEVFGFGSGLVKCPVVEPEEILDLKEEEAEEEEKVEVGHEEEEREEVREVEVILEDIPKTSSNPSETAL